MTLLVIEGESDSSGGAIDLFDHWSNATRDVLTLLHGREARILALVLEFVAGDGQWRSLAFENGALRWQQNEFRALAPDGYNVPELAPADILESFAHRPLVALWCRLFTSSLTEQRWDVRILRLWSVLETIAKRIAEGHAVELEVSQEDGPTSGTRSFTPRERVHALLRETHRALAVPVETALCHPDHALRDEIGVWYTVRNVVAHRGAWTAVSMELATDSGERRAVELMRRAVRPGDQLEEGFIRYRQHLGANAEAVIRAAIIGTLDKTLGLHDVDR